MKVPDVVKNARDTLKHLALAAVFIAAAARADITIAIGEEVQTATIAGTAGGFGILFPTGSIPTSATPYTITYSYAGGTTLDAAADTSTTLTVQPPAGPFTTWMNSFNWSAFSSPDLSLTGDPDTPTRSTPRAPWLRPRKVGSCQDKSPQSKRS